MKLAIIGASTGQLPMALKAKEMGLETICFAWPKGAVCKDVVDKFYPVSVLERDEILRLCKEEKVDGIATNASDLLVDVQAYVSEKMGLPGNSYECISNIKHKDYVRELSKSIGGITQISFVPYTKGIRLPFDKCVLKPVTGASKSGVYFIDSQKDLDDLKETVENFDSEFIIEKYVEGAEVSVESLSFKGKHFVIQITDKENSGAPHFVELSHKQPAQISEEANKKIRKSIPELLDRLGFHNGPTHIEIKIDSDDNIYLIEVNPRGGGDEISNTLVELSTGFDYVKAMIEVSLGSFNPNKVPLTSRHYSGIYFLCKQTGDRLPFFREAKGQPWLIKYNIGNESLHEATGNYDRDGYIIYQSEKPVNWEKY